MNRILVDTDVLIDYSKGRSRLLGQLLEKQTKGIVELFINPVVLAEYFTDKTLNNPSKRAKAYEFISFFGVISISKKMGYLAGELLREKKTSYLGDALIAATCIIDSLELATRNSRHFSKILKLRFYK